MALKLSLSHEEIRRLRETGASIQVIDVRDRSTYRRSNERVAGDLRFHGKGLRGAIEGVRPDSSLLTYCTCFEDGMAILAAERLRQAGYPNAYAVRDGLEGCRRAGLDVVGKRD